MQATGMVVQGQGTAFAKPQRWECLAHSGDEERARLRSPAMSYRRQEGIVCPGVTLCCGALLPQPQKRERMA